jgi:glycosyltransferase involved in cell wall biosynthesis
MMTKQPLVSIIIPNYNKEEFIDQTLESVFNQTYTNWECIVVDDHSTDGSWAILKKNESLDNRFKVIQRPIEVPKGGNHCRNYGLSQSKGDYIQFLDSDDILEANKIQKQVEQLLLEDLLVLSISNFSYFKNVPEEGANREINWDPFPSEGVQVLLKLWMDPFFIPPFSFFASRQLIESAGPWDPKIIQNQDGEYFCRVLLASHKVVFCIEALGFYRIPGLSNVSRISSEKAFESVLDSYHSYQTEILLKEDSEVIRKALALNYSRLVFRSIIPYPKVGRKALKHLKEVLKPHPKLISQMPQVIRVAHKYGFTGSRLLKLVQEKLKKRKG